MIDWVKAVIPWRHPAGLHDGQVLSITREGEVEWTTNKRLAVRGSYESALHILSDNQARDPETGDYLNIILDGNPVKFFQGHNLWGTDDLIGLVAETCLKVSEAINLPIPASDWQLIIDGWYHVKRIDSTAMLDIGNNASVESFLYSLERTGHMRYKGQGIMTKGTIYFGKHSRRESLKFYNKLTEIRAKGHRLPAELEALPHLISWVTGKLRAEHTLRSMQLKQVGLDIAGNWGENKPLEVLIAAMTGLNMSEQHTLTPAALDGLPPRLKPVYQLWIDGHDIRKIYARPTFYRYRKQLQELAGIDIAVKQGNRQEPAPNVIDFRRVLTPELVTQVPAWAVGTPLYFEPRARISA
jgi:II/X family phage/plasmid replication protein